MYFVKIPTLFRSSFRGEMPITIEKGAAIDYMMSTPKTLSVSEAAAICRVGRTTVGYWVRAKKLFARRTGRSFTIPVEDLLHFLVSSGQPIPPELGNGGNQGPLFKSFRNCWSFWQTEGGRHRCDACLAFKRQVTDCFSVRHDGSSGCPDHCRECRYFREMFAARFQFIHQIEPPAAVFKGLSLWGGNAGWAGLCGLPEGALIGLGIETIIHSASLARVISVFKKAALGEKTGLIPGPVYITTPQRKKELINAWVLPLRDPEGTNLMLAEKPKPATKPVKGIRDRDPEDPQRHPPAGEPRGNSPGVSGCLSGG